MIRTYHTGVVYMDLFLFGVREERTEVMLPLTRLPMIFIIDGHFGIVSTINSLVFRRTIDICVSLTEKFYSEKLSNISNNYSNSFSHNCIKNYSIVFFTTELLTI